MPKDWQCSMNQDQRGNSCTKGASEEWVEGSSEMVSRPPCPTHRSPGGHGVRGGLDGVGQDPGLPLVARPGEARVPDWLCDTGAQVDFCPDTEEFYWLDAWDDPARETAETGRLTHYHVMLFGAPSVTR